MAGAVRSGLDEVDAWCLAWAKSRRAALGIGKLIEPDQRLNKMRNAVTLAKAEDVDAIKHGGQSSDPAWANGYNGVALLVHRAYWMMPLHYKQVLNLHYVFREVAARGKAVMLGVSNAQWWFQINCLKAFIYGAILTRRDYDPTIVLEKSKHVSRALAIGCAP